MSVNTIQLKVGGPAIAVDKVGDISIEISKLEVGGENSTNKILGPEHPMPVEFSPQSAAAIHDLAIIQTVANDKLTRIDSKIPDPIAGKIPVTDPQSLPLPAGAAADDTLRLMIQLNDSILYYLAAILDKLPRLDAADRVIIGNEITQTVTGTLSSISALGVRNTPTDSIPFNLADMGSERLYRNIVVS